MTIKPTIAGIDNATGQLTTREMTDEELAQYEADRAAAPIVEEAPAVEE